MFSRLFVALLAVSTAVAVNLPAKFGRRATYTNRKSLE